MAEISKHVRVLVVDDSAFARLTITKYLQGDSDVEVIGTARDGLDAIDKIHLLKPDVVTMDVEMPRMNGIDALSQIMANCPTPVVMLSALTAEGADVTIKALELGALDFFLKPSLINPVGSDQSTDELINKVKMAARVDVSRLILKIRNILGSSKRSLPANQGTSATSHGRMHRLIVIGSSTGGPRALYQLVPSIPADISASILMVQHMPPKFTKSLADHLNEISQINVKEAEDGDHLQVGHAYMAPGGFHMIVKKGGEIKLTLDKPRGGLRPSVDVTMEAAVQIYGARCLGVILTGMGRDGTQGAGMIKSAGGNMIAEDQSTSVIYGMPRSVIEAGLADTIAPLDEIAKHISEYCESHVESAMGVRQ